VLSYTKMLGQLHDAGNTTTLAHYLELLSGSGLLTGLPKYSGKAVRQRGSSPKLQVFNSALMTSQSPHTFDESLADRELRGRLVESAVGACLVNAASAGECEVFYWRDRNQEVDYVVRAGRRTIAIEVKSGRLRETPAGLAAFSEAFPQARRLLVGGDGIPIEQFLLAPAGQWIEGAA
jgi:predicted AAA+ superfamily ATPase